jgi:voltage-gated potassium channel
MKDYRKKIYTLIFLLFILIIGGTAGYIIIEGWNFLDSLYMVIITLATVGYREVGELSYAGKIYTMFLILAGSGLLAYAVTNLSIMLFEGKVIEILRSRKMRKELEKLEGHYIVCGAGRTGIHIIDELKKLKYKIVVIDLSPPCMEDVIWLQKDATRDATLLEAGIKKAKGLATALPSDQENLFVVLTSKNLNPSLRIVTKCADDENEIKMRLAGADAVVSPNRIGGLRIASELVRPAVVSFLDKMLRAGEGTLRVEEARVNKGSSYAGKKVGELRKELEKNLSLLLMAISRKDNYIFNPPSEMEIKEDDAIIVMGNIDSVIELRKLLS